MLENLIYLVNDENGGLAFITDSYSQARQFLEEFGNDAWIIDSEEMC